MSRAIVLLALLLTSPLWAETQFRDLSQALARRDYSQAIAVSQRLEKEGGGSLGLYYNQGLAYRDLNQLARARASFEKALLYSPRDLETRRRLREIRGKLSPELADSEVKGTPWWTSQEGSLALVIAALLVLSLGLGRRAGRLVGGHPLGLSLALLLLAASLLAWQNPPAKRGVIVSKSAKLLPQPEGDASGPALPDGLMVEVLQQKGHFLQIREGSGNQGWVRQAELESL